MTGPLAFAAWHGYYFSRQYTSMHSMVIVPLQQRPSLAPAPSQGAPGGSGWLGAPRREANPPGAQPLPRVLELAASEVADFTASGRPGMNIVLNLLHSFRSRFLRRDIGRF